MQCLFRLLITLVLAASLLGGAVARGVAGVQMMQAETLRQIVICGHDGPATITVNAAGVPVAPKQGHCPRACPDCTTGPLALSGQRPALPPVQGAAFPVFVTVPRVPALVHPATGPGARAPPAKV